MDWDIFISYASEDKIIAARLSEQLKTLGLKVWIDTHCLKIGDPLSKVITDAIKKSKFGVVILSKSYYPKKWTRQELELFMQRDKAPFILPVLHNITETEFHSDYPGLEDIKAISITDHDFDHVSKEIHDAVQNRKEMERKFQESERHNSIKKFLAAVMAFLSVVYFAYSYAQPNLIIYTGQHGAAFSSVGEKIKEKLNNDPDINRTFKKIIIEETDGGIENCHYLLKEDTSNDIKLGFVQIAAYSDDDNSKCLKSKLSYLAPVYREIIHFVLRKEIYETIQAFYKGSNDEKIPCFIANLGLPIYIGKDGTTTQKIARKILDQCENKRHFQLNTNLAFEKAIAELNQENGQVKAGFFNQPPKAEFIESLLENGNICLLDIKPGSLGVKDEKALEGALQLSQYTPEEQVKDFYTKNNCDTSNGYQSLYSISVIAINENTNHETELKNLAIEKLMAGIYNNYEDFSKITPAFLNCKEAGEIIRKNPGLDNNSGVIKIVDEAKKYYSNECRT